MEDSALEQELIKLTKELKEDHGNEAETRLKIINRIVFEILNWDQSDVTVEVRVVEDGEAAV